MAITVLWANDGKRYCSCAHKRQCYWCLSIIVRQDTLDTSLKNPFMFVVIESEKVNSNALYVKVNGMTLLP